LEVGNSACVSYSQEHWISSAEIEGVSRSTYQGVTFFEHKCSRIVTDIDALSALTIKAQDLSLPERRRTVCTCIL
jgi:hypothetical protein